MLAGLTALLGGGAGGGGSFESIATVTGSGQSEITFSSIPSTYKHLQIRAIVRDNTNYGSAATVGLNMNINSDSSSSYTLHRLYGDGTNAGARGVINESKINMERCATTAGVTASVFGTAIIDIQDYGSTTKNKTVRTFYGIDANTSGTQFQVNAFSGLWINTAAITNLSFTMDGTFSSGSSIALYGVKG